MDEDRQVWEHLTDDWRPEMLENLASEIELIDLDEEIAKILRGEQVGRRVVRLRG